ncbi:MAG: ABC-2 family transporter protein [Armatimonadetes bacterium]|nr:ABC-2 family transporter protein [Armatimonadota bacterium]
MNLTLRKSLALFKVWFQDGLSYRAAGVIWILTDTVPAMIMPLVFISAMPEGGSIRGFTASEFVLYYLTMILVINFVVSHLMWELSMEIKEGIFTINLLRPVSYFQVCFIRNISWRVLRIALFLPMFLLLLVMYRSYLASAHAFLGWEFWAAILLGHMVSFTFVYMMSMLALFVEEAHAIFELYYFPMLFLSGQMFPIHLLPDWAATLAKAMPFYYTSGLPVEIVIGRIPPEAAHPLILVQLVWIGVHLMLAKVLWRWGLRHYTAVGM